MSEIATGNRDDALDIVQDAMFRLVDKYADRPVGDWPPLFHRILQNRIRDWHRRAFVKRRVTGLFKPTEAGEADTPALERYPDPTVRTAESRMHTDRLIERLKPALNGLPRRQQQVFLLRVFEGLDVRETAAAMRCSEGSVKTHYSRAMSTLRTKLGDLTEADYAGS